MPSLISAPIRYRSVNALSEHHYQGNIYASSVGPASLWPIIAHDLVLKANVRSNLSQYAQSANLASRVNLPLVLGETNTYNHHGFPGVSNTAAAALWIIDYALQAASIGLSGINLHEGVGNNYSSWVPIDHVGADYTDWSPDAKRHILPLYVGLVAVTDAIGGSGCAVSGP